MAGVEAVGLALAILPLIISSIENYQNVSSRFARFRKFAPEVNRFQMSLKAQKAIFENECRLLLCNVTDQGTADLILTNPSQSSHVNHTMASDFALQMGRCGEACFKIVEQIKQELGEIGIDGERLQSVASQCTSDQVRPNFHVMNC